jgi:hypothetical protein
MQEAIASVDEKAQAYHGEVAAKATVRENSLVALSSVSRSAYAKVGITNQQLIDAGLQPHSTSRAKIVPATPTDLIVSPNADGNVALKWDRNGNPGSVTFQIESSTDCLNWTIVATTTRAKATLSVYTPGVQTWFRVRAQRNETVTAPSAQIPIYPSGGESSMLKVA